MLFCPVPVVQVSISGCSFITRKNETVIELQRKDGAQSYLLGDGYISLLGTMDMEEGSITDNADYRLYKMPAGFKMP